MLSDDDLNRCPSIFYGAFAQPSVLERLLLIIYPIIFIIGVVGNIMTIVIIKCNAHLRTPTNFYLLNLAVSDLMILMCNLPIEMVEIHQRQWPLPVIFCKLRSICAEFFTCSSILTILAFTCERYFAIVQPVHFHRLSHFRRAQNIIVIILLASLLFSVPFGFLHEVVTVVHVIPLTAAPIPVPSTISSNNTVSCRSCVPKESVTKLLSIIIIITSLCFFYLPMIIIGAIYLFIGKALRQVNKYENTSNPLQTSITSLSSVCNTSKKQAPTTPCHALAPNKEILESNPFNSNLGSYSWLKTRARCQARKVVVKTLVAVVIAFFACYAPLYIQRLLLAIMNLNLKNIAESSIFNGVIAHLYIISGTTFYLGSVINPILYNVVSNKYRRAFRDLFCCRLKCTKKTNTKRQKTPFPLNRPNKPVMQPLPKAPGVLPQQGLYLNGNHPLHIAQQKGIQETRRKIVRPVSPPWRSKSSSSSSLNQEPQSPNFFHSNGSATKKCQVQTNTRFSLRRKLLTQKAITDPLPWLVTRTKT